MRIKFMQTWVRITETNRLRYQRCTCALHVLRSAKRLLIIYLGGPYVNGIHCLYKPTDCASSACPVCISCSGGKNNRSTLHCREVINKLRVCDRTLRIIIVDLATHPNLIHSTLRRYREYLFSSICYFTVREIIIYVKISNA